MQCQLWLHRLLSCHGAEGMLCVPCDTETGMTSRLLHGAFQTDGRVSDLVFNINTSCMCNFRWETASYYCLQSQRMSGRTSLTIPGSLSAVQCLETQSLPTPEHRRNGFPSSVCKILFSVFIFSFRFVGVAEADPANIYSSQVLCVEFLGVQWELSPGRAQACSGLSVGKFSCIFWLGVYIYTYTHIHAHTCDDHFRF